MTSRVRCNLRVVVSVPELRGIVKSGCYKWKELLGSMAIYNELPWERKRLVEVATYHLEGTAEYIINGNTFYFALWKFRSSSFLNGSKPAKI